MMRSTLSVFNLILFVSSIDSAIYLKFISSALTPMFVQKKENIFSSVKLGVQYSGKLFRKISNNLVIIL